MAQQICNQFEPTTNTSSATICKWCGQEKFLHAPKVGNMAQQTAVEWLEKKIEEKRFQCQTEWQSGYQSALNEVIFFLEQAKAMEKEQIIDAYRFPNTLVDMSSEQYYNETYNK
jgi:hypothetical protein